MKLSTNTPAELRSPLNRPKVSFSLDDEMSTGKEADSSSPLPIVELKPFVQKVWRRENSLASFYHKNDISDSGSRNSTGSKGKETGNETEAKAEELSPPPRSSHSLPASLPSRLLQLQTGTFSENKNQKEPSLSNVSQDLGTRPKSRIHPPVDSKTQRQPEHSVSLIPGFITREDREKATFTDITEGEFANRAYSCSPKNLRPHDQTMKVTGENVTHVLHPKHYVFPNSWRASGSFQAVRHGSPASMLYFHKPLYEKHTRIQGTHIYDHLDRKGVLPSLTVKPKSLKKRMSRQYDENDSEDYRDYRDAYDVTTMHNVGGIENSLRYLSEQGAPTKIERMLSFHLELNLSRFRTCKDYSPLETSPSELAKYYSTPSFNLTRGEVDIRKGLLSNTPKRKRGTLRNIDPLTKDGLLSLTTASEYQKLQNRKSRIFEHLKALETKKPDHGVFERNDSRETCNIDREKTTMTLSDDELIVPNDTPRTLVDSRVSFKPAEVAIVEQSTETQTAQVGIRENSLLIPDEERDLETLNGALQSIPRQGNMEQRKNNVNRKAQMLNRTEYDREGNTFITSDTRAHITVTG